jgi:hypothetical protein
MIESNLRVPPIDDAGLRSWFEQRRARYDVPSRYDFSEAVMSGDHDQAAAQRFAAALNAGTDDDVKSGLRIFEGRPRNTIVDSFGAQFADALDGVALGSWQVLPSSAGPRVVRLETHKPGVPASFDAVQSRVRQDWQDEKAQTLRTDAVRELGKKYKVQLAGEKQS